MTSSTTTTTDNNNSSKYEFYPEYCNAVSPTINKWCPLTAHDIYGLTWKVRIEDQKYIFFHLNHPISWVRIVGVVVAIDSFYSRRIYTIDDSSGSCIECCVTLPPPDKTATTTITAAATAAVATTTTTSTTSNSATAADPYPHIETGLVVDIKGALTVFRHAPQIAVAKMAPVRSTAAEVAFWAKIRAFRTETLARPWRVDADTARRLKRENERDLVVQKRPHHHRRQERQLVADGRSRGSGRRSRREEDEDRTRDSNNTRDSRRQKREGGGGERRSSKRKADGDAEEQEATTSDQTRRRDDPGKKGWEGNPSLRQKPYRPSKLSEVATNSEGQYDALGL